MTEDPVGQPALLFESLEQAELLLAYAASNGLTIPDQTAQTIIKSKDLLGKNLFTGEYESQTAFWKAREELAKAVAPVSPQSLRQSAEQFPDKALCSRVKGWIFRRPLPSVTRAKLTVRKMYCWTLFTLIALIFIQIYTGIGSSLVNDIQQYLKMVDENSVKQEIVRKSASDHAADSLELQGLEADAERFETETDVRFESLEKWNAYWRFVVTLGTIDCKAAITTDDPYRALKQSLLKARFALDALQRYVLPLLYGLLGACLYVLRSLAQDIRNQSFTRDLVVVYHLRMVMGALAGSIMVWLFLDVIKDEASLKALTPPALAFVVGYGVEILFAFLDRIIEAFSPRKT